MTHPRELPVSVARCAAIFGVTSKCVRDWISEGMPVLKRGARGAGNGSVLDLAAVVSWYVARRAGPFDPQQELARKNAALADRTEMENALRRGELCVIEDMQKAWADHIGVARTRLLAIPATVAPRVAGIADVPLIAAAIRTEIYGALTELSEYTP